MALTKVEAEQLQPAQTSITSVGTLTGLTSSGTLSVTNQVAIRETAPGIQSGHSSAHSLQVGRWGGSNNRWMIVPEPEGSPLYSRELSYSFDTDTWAVEGSFAATLSTAAQPNITSVGTLTGLTVSGNTTIRSGNKLIINRTDNAIGGEITYGPTGTGFIINDANGDDTIFKTGSTEHMRILGSGNVIINKGNFSSLPTGSKLNIFGDGITLRLDGTSGTTKSILFRGTNVANPGEVYADGSLRFRTEDASTRITFHTNSSGSNNERMRIESNGNVGIGVVPETHFSGVDALQVGLGASLVGNTTNPSRTYLNANAYINSSNQESYVATDEASQYFQNAGTHIFKVASSGSAGSAISWTTAMTIDNNGNVLVGSTDTSLYNNTSGGGIMLAAANRLDVARDGDVVATFNRSSGAGEVINLYQGGSKAGGLGVSGTDITIGTGDTGITFEDAADTVHPVNFSSGAARTGAINLGKDAARFQHLYLSALLDIKSSNCSGFLQVGSNVLQFGTSTNDPVIFYTSNDERMRLTSTGNLLIGRNGTNNGSTDHGVNLYNTGQIYLYVNSTGNTDAVRVYDGNGALKAAIDSDGDYIDHSDINAKENIQDASSVLSTLSDVKVRSFTWKADGRNQAYGFIAQELKEVVPEAVSPPETEDEMWGVKHAKLVPMLVKAVQEQQATITALEARIVQLENK